jgi:hypothetical protein
MTAKVVSPPPASAPESYPKSSPSRPPPTPVVRKPVPQPISSPAKSSPMKSSPVKPDVYTTGPESVVAEPTRLSKNIQASETPADGGRSPSDGSSPIRPIVRKSSMNFASLPAREPLTSNKNAGGRLSRISHLDQTRKSYYSHHPGNKNTAQQNDCSEDDDIDDDMDIDHEVADTPKKEPEKEIASQAKTYTQRLQDRISMLGKAPTNAPRPSKSLANPSSLQSLVPLSQAEPQAHSQPVQVAQKPQEADVQIKSSPRKDVSSAAPGAFPDDDEDDWIAPPPPEPKAAAQTKEPSIFSPRPAVAKSYSADVMENVLGKTTVSEAEFVLPKQRLQGTTPSSPKKAVVIPERTTSVHKHSKSASVPHLPNVESMVGVGSPKKAISVSNPTLASVSEDGQAPTPSKSPSRNFRDSPLKQVKNKLSSILKSSKGLLASSAALSAEGKSSLLSPSTTRLGIFSGPSVESLAPSVFQGHEALYPDLSQHVPAAPKSPSRSESPARSTSTRRTRASAEREKKEQKQKEKEAKEAQKLVEQMEKLEKMREKEREKARVFSEEQEKAAIEKRVAAQEDAENKPRQPTSPAKEPARATRTSPRKAKAQVESVLEKKTGDEDIEMADAPSSMPPPPLPRSAIPGQGSRSVKRPIKPSKEIPVKSKQAPTVIKVNTTSSQSQFHPSNSVLAATLQDTLGHQQPQLKGKASTASLQTKPSLQSLKSSTMSSAGRPKALDLAARRKEQEEREAQRKRDVKAEMERKRAVLQEEERKQEEQRRLEAQRQKERDREQTAAAAEAKKNAQRQAMIEKAKQTRAPPPPQRSQVNGSVDYSASRADAGPPRPPSRLATASRSQEEQGRPNNAVLSNAGKAPSKRPLQGDSHDEGPRSGLARSGLSHQATEAKRMRMSEDFDEDELEVGGQPVTSKIKGPPIRPSAGFKKVCLQIKPLFMVPITDKCAGFASQDGLRQRLRKRAAKRDQGSLQGDSQRSARKPCQGKPPDGHGSSLQGCHSVCSQPCRSSDAQNTGKTGRCGATKQIRGQVWGKVSVSGFPTLPKWRCYRAPRHSNGRRR